jgi:hypothetical protein
MIKLQQFFKQDSLRKKEESDLTSGLEKTPRSPVKGRFASSTSTITLAYTCTPHYFLQHFSLHMVITCQCSKKKLWYYQRSKFLYIFWVQKLRNKSLLLNTKKLTIAVMTPKKSTLLH